MILAYYWNIHAFRMALNLFLVRCFDAITCSGKLELLTLLQYPPDNVVLEQECRTQI